MYRYLFTFLLSIILVIYSDWVKTNFFYLFFFFFFRAATAVYGDSQARGQMGAAAASLYHIYVNICVRHFNFPVDSWGHIRERLGIKTDFNFPLVLFCTISNF